MLNCYELADAGFLVIIMVKRKILIENKLRTFR